MKNLERPACEERVERHDEVSCGSSRGGTEERETPEELLEARAMSVVIVESE